MTGPSRCPFCGAPDLGWVPGDLVEHPPLYADGGLAVISTGDGWYAVRCRCCDAMGPRVKATKARACEEAIEAWNKRSLLTAG